VTIKKNQLKAKEAWRLLNDYVGDLCTGTQIWRMFETMPQFANASDRLKILLRRMCLFYLVVTLFKVEEICESYKAIFPGDVRDARQKLMKDLKQRGVRKARNTVVGHIQDNELKRPLMGDEVEKILNSVVGDSPEAFQLWINNPVVNVFPQTVVAVCERIRDRIAEEYGFGERDLAR
jgi:hypothetical protein